MKTASNSVGFRVILRLNLKKMRELLNRVRVYPETSKFPIFAHKPRCLF